MLGTTVRRAVTLARWDDPARLLIDRFAARAAREVPRDARVLDAGAGECGYASAFAHCRYVACDRAVGDAAWDYTRVDVIADLAALPFRKDAFDAVLCTQALEHLGEPAAALRDLATVLKPGGRLYASAPFLGDPLHQEPYDFFRYTTYGLRHLLARAGLTPVSITPMGGPLFLLCCGLWWAGVVARDASRPGPASRGRLARGARRLAASALLVLARVCTMLTLILGRTEPAAARFTYGYTVVAEKRAHPDGAGAVAP